MNWIKSLCLPASRSGSQACSPFLGCSSSSRVKLTTGNSHYNRPVSALGVRVLGCHGPISRSLLRWHCVPELTRLTLSLWSLLAGDGDTWFVFTISPCRGRKHLHCPLLLCLGQCLTCSRHRKCPSTIACRFLEEITEGCVGAKGIQ
jgi:hypothetical protein